MLLAPANPIRRGFGVTSAGNIREARLSVHAAQRYPWIHAGEWQPAALLADRVLAGHLLRGGYAVTRGRVLHEAHFEFRGGTARSDERNGVRPRREDR
jgi:hypothetical protein